MAESAIDEIPNNNLNEDLKRRLYANLRGYVGDDKVKLILRKEADLYYTKEKDKIRFIEEQESLRERIRQRNNIRYTLSNWVREREAVGHLQASKLLV